MLFRRLPMVALSLLATSKAFAAGADAPVGLGAVEAHGFASQGFILSTGNNYLAKSKSGSFEFSEIGINFTNQLTDRLRFGVQLFAHKLGPSGDYTATMDWFYMDYRFADWFGIRAGRTKLPFGLYNEVNDIDAARVPILLPQSVYPVTNRDNLLAQTGVELYGRLDFRTGGVLDYRLYGGTIIFTVANQPGSPFVVQDLRVPYLAGGRLMWETPLEGFRVGGSLQALQLDAQLVRGMSSFTLEIPAILSVASAEYALRDWLFSVEYSRWFVSTHTEPAGAFPETGLTVSERGYAMVSYRVTDWFQPGAYYSLYYKDVDHRQGRDARQFDLAGTLRFDLNDHWLLKLEGHYMAGTLALTPMLNDNQALSKLDRYWGLVLAKMTAYF
jgi:hypothetical protein